MRVIKLLVGRPPRTVGELTRLTGVTRTAITEQLNEMVAGGFVNRTIEHLAGRGRPRHRYTATQAALVLLFANNQQLVVPAIWKAVDKVGGKELTQKVLHAVSRQLAEHYLARITASLPRERMDQFKAILQEEGGLLRSGLQERQDYRDAADLPIHQHVRRATARLRDRPRGDGQGRRLSGASDLLSS